MRQSDHQTTPFRSILPLVLEWVLPLELVWVKLWAQVMAPVQPAAVLVLLLASCRPYSRHRLPSIECTAGAHHNHPTCSLCSKALLVLAQVGAEEQVGGREHGLVQV